VRAVNVRGVGLREGDLADGLAALDEAFKTVAFGSYPFYAPEGFGATLVARSSDAAALAQAQAALEALAASFGVTPQVWSEGET
jgi:hypothetical protein